MIGHRTQRWPFCTPKLPPMNSPEVIAKITSFAHSLGIETKAQKLAHQTFIPGVDIQDGALVYDLQSLSYPGDLLHELGHIAISKPSDRYQLNGNVTVDHPEKEGEELAVILWTYAACQHLSIPQSIVFHENGYKGESSWLLENFQNGNFIGLPLLVWMGMTLSNADQEGFPKMIKWLRE